MSRAALAVLWLAACGGRAPLADCDDDLGGVYTSGDARWMVLDLGTTVEAYPLFTDVPPGGETGPRMLELARPTLAGTVRRRYMQQAARCDAAVPARITRCRGDTLELVLTEPAAPLGFAPCTWPRPAGSRVERWRRP